MASYVDYTGANFEFVDTPDADLDDPTGDFELIVCVEFDSWANNWTPLMSKHNGTGSITYIWQMRPGAGGTVYQQIEIRDNTNTTFVNQSSIDDLVTAPTAHRWFRIRYDHDTGAGSYALDYWYSDDPITTAVGSVTWTATGATDTGTNATLNTGTETTKLIGTTFTTNQGYAAGKLYCASILYGGTEVANPDFRDGTQTSDSGATFVDSYTNTWTIGGTNSWVEVPDTVPFVGLIIGSPLP